MLRFLEQKIDIKLSPQPEINTQAAKCETNKKNIKYVQHILNFGQTTVTLNYDSNRGKTERG